MLKKLVTILLSMVMLITLFPTAVLGALPTEELTATDGVIGTGVTGVASDNFDDKDITTAAFKDYATTVTTSKLFYTFAAKSSKAYNIKYEAGESGNKVLEITSSLADLVVLQPLKMPIQTNYVAEFSYDIRFTELPTGAIHNTSGIKLGINTTGALDMVWSSDDNAWRIYSGYNGANTTGKLNPTLNTWYKITASVDGNKALNIYIADKDTGEIKVTASLPSKDAWSNSDFYVVQMPANANQSTVGDMKMEIDNAKMVVYDQTQHRPSVAESNVDTASAPINTKTLVLTFDQPISEAPTEVTITPASGTAITGTVAKLTGRLNTYSIALPAEPELLTAQTQHTVDLSAFKGAGTLYAENYVFTTGAQFPVLTASVPESGATNVSVETASISLTFDTEMTNYPDTVTLTGGSEPVTATVTPDAEKKSFTLSWTGELQGSTAYTLSLAGFKNDAGDTCLTESITFTTETVDIITESDSFEDASLLSVSTAGYATKGASPLTMPTTAAYGTDVGKDEVLSLQPHNGGTALAFKTGSEAGTTMKYIENFKTYKAYSLETDEKLVATWRFNLKEMGAYDGVTKQGAKIAIGCTNATWLSFGNTMTYITTRGGKPFIYHSNDNVSTGVEIAEDHWYNIVYVMEKTNQILYVVDAVTGEVIYRREKLGHSNETIQPFSEEQPAYIYVASGLRTETKTGDVVTEIVNEDQEFWIDDFTLWRIRPESKYQKLSLTEAEEGQTIARDGSLSMTFNQPILANSGMLEVYKGTGKNELAYSTPKVKHTDFCTQEISFTNLDYSTDYTLDYSGMTAVSGADMGDATVSSVLSFKTADSPEAAAIVGEIAVSGLSAGSTISFDLYSKEAESVTVFAAFYERGFPPKLIGVERKTVAATPGGTAAVSIPLSKAHAADSIKLYVWSGDSTLQPLMAPREVTAPAESLKVLMIGNSLSEDAQRYLNGIAQAGGLSLDLTVKGIGGKSLADHAENLKNELAGNPTATYFTYKNGVYQSATEGNKLLTDAFANGEEYDVISLQQFSAYNDSDFEEALPYLASTLRELQPNAEIVVYQTWSNYSGDRAARNYYFTNTIESAVAKWTAYTGANVEGITLNGAPMKVIPAGAAFYLADNKYDWCGAAYTGEEGGTDEDAKNDVTTEMNAAPGLWRDYNHASYYGCYLADAVWFEMLTGKKAPTTDSEDTPLVPAPTGVEAAEHLERLAALSDVAHQVVMEQNN